MAADFEIDYIHVGKVPIHHQPIVLDAYILLIDIFDFRQRFNSCRFTQFVYLVSIAYRLCKHFLCRCHEFIQCHLSAVLGRGKNMDNLALVLGIPQASANLCEQRGNIHQRMCLASVADDECNAVLVVNIAPLKTGRGVKVDFPYGV